MIARECHLAFVILSAAKNLVPVVPSWGSPNTSRNSHDEILRCAQNNTGELVLYPEHQTI